MAEVVTELDDNTEEVRPFSSDKDLEIVFQFQKKTKESMDLFAVKHFVQNFNSQLESREWFIRVQLKMTNPPGTKLERIKRARRIANGPILRVTIPAGNEIEDEEDVIEKMRWTGPCSKFTIRDIVGGNCTDLSNVVVSPRMKKSKFGAATVRPHEIEIPIWMLRPAVKAERCDHRVCDFQKILECIRKTRARIQFRRFPGKGISATVDDAASTDTEGTYVTALDDLASVRDPAEENAAEVQTEQEARATTQSQSHSDEIIMEFGGPNESNDNKDIMEMLLGDQSKDENAISFGFNICSDVDERKLELVDNDIETRFPSTGCERKSKEAETSTKNSNPLVLSLRRYLKNLLSSNKMSNQTTKRDKRKPNLTKGKEHGIAKSCDNIVGLIEQFKDRAMKIRDDVVEEFNQRGLLVQSKPSSEDVQSACTSKTVKISSKDVSEGVNAALLQFIARQQRVEAAQKDNASKSVETQQPTACTGGARPKQPFPRPVHAKDKNPSYCHNQPTPPPFGKENELNTPSKLLEEIVYHVTKSIVVPGMTDRRMRPYIFQPTSVKRQEATKRKTGARKNSASGSLVVTAQKQPEPQVPSSNNSRSKKNKQKKR